MSSLRCTYCGAETHTAANCPKTWAGQAARAQMRCAYCGKGDHKVTACPELGRLANPPDDYVLD